MVKRRTATGAALGLSAALTLSACSSGDVAPRPSVIPTVCAEATGQVPILTDAQLNRYMKAAGACIFGLEQKAPSGQQTAENNYEFTVNAAEKTGVAQLTLTDKQSGAGSVSWSILERFVANRNTQNGGQADTYPYDVAAQLTSEGGTKPTDWRGLLQTNNLQNKSDLFGVETATNAEQQASLADWHTLQRDTDTLLGLTEIAVLNSLSSSASATANGIPV